MPNDEPEFLLLKTLLDELSFGTSAFDSDWRHVYSNQAGESCLDDIAVFGRDGQLVRLGSVTSDELGNATDGEPLKSAVDGPPPRILETQVKTLALAGQSTYRS